jgi:hypothetical protein
MDASAVFNTSERMLEEMQARGLAGQEIAQVLTCAVVQNCLMTMDPVATAKHFTKEIERLARANLTWLESDRKAKSN